MLWLALSTTAGGAAATQAGAADFPEADGGYHNYGEVTAETLAIAEAHPDLVRRISIDKSLGGLDIQ
jgi:hypothetical protein